MKTVGCVLLFSAFVLLQAGCQKPEPVVKEPTPKPESTAKAQEPALKPGGDQSAEMMARLRNMALTMTPEQINVTVPSTGRGVWGSVTDFGSPQGTVTLVTFLDGSTSLYFSTGGGIIGTGDISEEVRKASRELLEKLDLCTAQMVARPPQKIPTGEAVRFYVHTRDGLVSSAEIPEAEVQSSDHPLFPCYVAAQHVFTQARLASEKK